MSGEDISKSQRNGPDAPLIAGRAVMLPTQVHHRAAETGASSCFRKRLQPAHADPARPGRAAAGTASQPARCGRIPRRPRRSGAAALPGRGGRQPGAHYRPGPVLALEAGVVGDWRGVACRGWRGAERGLAAAAGAGHRGECAATARIRGGGRRCAGPGSRPHRKAGDAACAACAVARGPRRVHAGRRRRSGPVGFACRRCGCRLARPGSIADAKAPGEAGSRHGRPRACRTGLDACRGPGRPGAAAGAGGPSSRCGRGAAPGRHGLGPAPPASPGARRGAGGTRIQSTLISANSLVAFATSRGGVRKKLRDPLAGFVKTLL